MSPLWIKNPRPSTIPVVGRMIQVPCGKCVECKQSRRSEWCVRNMCELLDSVSAWFVTLTYDDDHVPAMGVKVDHLQKFFKRLRRCISPLSYFACSEYGEKTLRPHYHMLLYFHEIVDIERMYKLIIQNWTFGMCYIGSVTPSSIIYCTKYILKDKQKPQNQNATFNLVSRRPALGSGALDPFSNSSVVLASVRYKNLADFFANSSSIVFADSKGVVPRYFRKKGLTDEQQRLRFCLVMSRLRMRRLSSNLSDAAARKEWYMLKQKTHELELKLQNYGKSTL